MKEKLPKTFRSWAVQKWYHDLENPTMPYPHFLLDLLLTSSIPHGGLPWLRRNWAPFLTAADESLGHIAREWGKNDDELPAETGRLSVPCQELAKFCDRFGFLMIFTD